MDFVMDYGYCDLDSDLNNPHGRGLPGGPGFEDVTELFEDAVFALDPETMLFMDGFSLQDSMSAFEIGEPRLDTGYIGDNPLAEFNPLQPLLPEELCWILDKALGYELEWHDGKLLPHTVFTLQYIHHLRDIEPDIMSWDILSDSDPDRPIELITVVLSVCVVALVKCVDLAWLEMHNNELIQDTEDWQSEKCEIALLETIPVKYVVQRLAEAIIWVKTTDKVPEKWRDPLISRISLRKTLLELMHIDPSQQRLAYHSALASAQKLLRHLSSRASPEVSPKSPAREAFDSHVSRKLNTSVPIRVIPVPSNERVWELLNAFLDGLEETVILAGEHILAIWETVGKMRVWLKDAPRPAYVRSLTQSCFYNGLLVLNQHPFSWALDKLFEERIGLSWKRVREYVESVWPSDNEKPSPVIQIERRMYKLLISHVKLHWSNLSRMRRKLAKLAVEWHHVYDLCINLVEGISDKLPKTHLIRLLPATILTFRLESIRDLVMSGFQLELLAPYEKPFACWYLASVLDELEAIYNKTILFLAPDSPQSKDLCFKSHLSSTLSSMFKSYLLLSLPTLSKANLNEVRPNFYKRYKWAFRPDYERINAGPVGHPDYEAFLEFCEEVIEEQEDGEGRVDVNPKGLMERARSTVEEMLERRAVSPWVGTRWGEDMAKFLKGIREVCSKALSNDLPSSAKELEAFDSRALKWDPEVHPWFPSFLKRDG